jgi:hypothetical protein
MEFNFLGKQVHIVLGISQPWEGVEGWMAWQECPWDQAMLAKANACGWIEYSVLH